MLVIGVFGRQVRFKPINKVDAGTTGGGTIVRTFSRNLGTIEGQAGEYSEQAVGRTFCNRRVSRIMRYFLLSNRSDESPVRVMHTLYALPLSISFRPKRLTTGYRSKITSLQRNQLSEPISDKIVFCLPNPKSFLFF